MGDQASTRYVKHQFTAAERFAVFNTYGDRCYIGGEQVTAVTFEVDHILPEKLLRDESKLRETLELFGLPDNFNLNDYGNWLPACRPCNGHKLQHVFRPTPAIQIHLDRARAKADDARKREKRAIGEKELGKAVATLAKHHDVAVLPQGYEAVAVAVEVLAKAHDDPKIPDAYKGVVEAARLAVTLPGDIEEWAAPIIEDYEAEHSPTTRTVGAQPGTSEKRLYLTPSQWVPLKVLSDDGRIAIAEGPYGIGGGPSPSSHPGLGPGCWSCGSTYWNGPRCVVCGALNDD